MSEILDWWESIHTFYQAVVSISCVAILGILGFFLKRLINYVISVIQRKRERDDQKLHTHFMEIKPEAISIIDILNRLTNYYGWLLTTQNWLSGNKSLKYGSGIIQIPTQSFSSHFPIEALKLEKYRKHVEDHNEKRYNLDIEIKRDFESQKIAILNVNDTSKRPFYVYDNIYQPLFQWWYDRNKQKPNIWINFNKIGIKAGESPDNLYVEGWGAHAIAYAKTDNGKKRCKNAIRKVANSTKYKQDVSYLTISSDIILISIGSLANNISDKISDVESFWPGTKSYKFKKKRSCQRCKEVLN